MKQEIYLVRHGHSSKQDSEGKDLDDQTRPLSQQGIEETTLLALHLRENSVQPDVIISSTLTRARQTATILAEQLGNPPIQTNDYIGEADFGTLPDNKETLILTQYGYNSQPIIDAGGKPIAEVENQANTFLQDIATSKHDCVIIVSHGFTLSVMSQLLQNLDRTFENIQILRTSDYSYFLVDSNHTPLVAIAYQTNIMHGPVKL